MAVRAKFTVTSVTEHHYSQAKTIKLTPVYDPNLPEDQRFSKATPSGELTMYVDNPSAAEQLKLGQAFYLDFTPVS